MKYWIESSYDFEDIDKEYSEQLVVGANYGEDGTETIGWLENGVIIMSPTLIDNLKDSITEILNRINSDIENEGGKCNN